MFSPAVPTNKGVTLRVVLESPIEIPFWTRQPMLRLLLPVIAGIAGYAFYPHLHWVTWLLAAGCCFAVIAWIQTMNLGQRFVWEPLRGLAWSLLWCLLGYGCYYSSDNRNDADWYGKYIDKGGRFQVVVISCTPSRTGKSVKLELQMEYWVHAEKRKAASGTVLGWWPLSNTDTLPSLGSRWWISNQLQPLKNSSNPGAFDWVGYAQRQNWHHQLYLRPEHFGRLATSRSVLLQQFLHVTQEYIKGKLHQYLVPAAVGLAEALLLGYRLDVDQQTLQAYSDAGVIHLIAVSGMHLGLIYLVLIKLFQMLPNRWRHPLRESLIAVAAIWLFTLLTGAGASVVRAAVMLSCLQVARLTKRPAHPLNQLWLSAFVLLLFQPAWLWDVGFQLSYAAVGGILWAYPILRRWLFGWPPWARHLGELIAVSVAAQLFTTPIAIYHFHQFPNYFLLANLLTVALASGLLIGLLILLPLTIWPWAALAWGNLLSVGLLVLSYMVRYISQLPGAITKPIPADGWWLTLTTIYFFLWLYGWRQRRIKIAIAGIAFAALSYIYQLRLHEIANQTNTLTLFDTRGFSLFNVKAGQRTWTWVGSKPNQEIVTNQETRSILEPAHVHQLVRQSSIHRLPSGIHFHKLGKHRLLRVDVTLSLSEWVQLPEATLVFFGPNARPNWELCQQRFPHALFVLEPSISKFRQTQWANQAQALTLRCWPVSERGALTLSW